ncbi:MAG: RNA polymerase sigma factor [Planctomycetota bacterium]
MSQHLAPLYRYACALGADSDQARDLCQEAFVAAWRKQKQSLPPAALASFLRRAARFAFLQSRRKDRRQEVAVLREVDAIWSAPDPDHDHDARVAAVRACVAQLKGRAAEAVRCTYGLGHGREQVAATLGMKPNGVKTLLARTRRWLARCIEGRQS